MLVASRDANASEMAMQMLMLMQMEWKLKVELELELKLKLELELELDMANGQWGSVYENHKHSPTAANDNGATNMHFNKIS
ncbi:GH13528 [Drosophila grimshawi]|uniref:GH13528 n=1 Tax=Drosophila grimshawi TaxID=7222 RepID=B4JPI9_DROGR|nr:GH13528 [Drosophila grimshawi]